MTELTSSAGIARRSLITRSIKRTVDVTLALLTLVLLSPLFLFVGAVVAVSIGRPIFFSQLRPGLNGEPFLIRKFRTMTDTRNPNGDLLPDADRLTRFGQLLRSTSLDELPEFWNVLKGEMSLVGPRPLLLEYLDLYPKHHLRRHDVKPGITGWAQIHGRNATTWDNRLNLDIWYVDNWSNRLDLSILARTVIAVVHRRGISSDTHVTMEDYSPTSYSARRDETK